MKEYPAEKIRNIALVGHSGTGKTSLTEAMLFAAGATTRLGKIEDGSTVSDWDPDEQKRQFSLNVSILPVEWNGHKINVLDTPGYMDFMGEVKCGLRAVELAVITVDAVSGVQVGTEFAWRFANELDLPRAVIVKGGHLEDFTTALYRELVGTHLHISVLRAGPVLTEFSETAASLQGGYHLPTERIGVTAEIIADKIWGLLMHPRRVIYVPAWLAVTPFIEGSFGWLIDRLGPLLLRRHSSLD